MSAQLTKEKILSAFRKGDRLLSAEIIARTGMSRCYVSKMLCAMTAEGSLARIRTGNGRRHGGSLEFTYCLKEDEILSDEPPALPTPAAYRNLRLTENLTGYESSLHSFAALCMLVRK